MIPQLKGQLNQADQEAVPAGDKEHLIKDGDGININHIAGVVEQTEIDRLRRLVFRSTKGKSYIYVSEYNDPDDLEQKVPRSVYIVVFWDG